MNKTVKKEHTFSLLNIENWHAQYPDTFWIPDRRIRESVKTGNIVKLVFKSNDAQYMSERMWVIIRECIPGNRFIGTLDNDPMSLPLKHGVWVRFGPENVLDIDDE